MNIQVNGTNYAWEQKLKHLPIQYADKAAGVEGEATANPKLIAKWKELFAKVPNYPDKLTEKEIENIASVVDTAFRESEKNLYLPKGNGIPRALFINPTDETVYLFSTKRGSKASGGNKKVYDALKFSCLQFSPTLVECRKDVRKIVKQTTFSKKELALEAHFSKIFEIISRPSKSGEMTIQMIQEAYDGNLKEIYDELGLEDCIEIFSQVLDYLGKMYKEGFVHGDIKAGNILVEKLPQDGWKVKVNDFEFSYNPKIALFPKSPKLVQKHATARYTAPELLNKTFSSLADEFARGQSEDMFALGCLFLRLFSTKESLPEGSHVWNREWYEKLILDAEELTNPVDCKVAVIAIALLDPDPKSRMTFPDLLTQFHELMEIVQQSIM